MGVAELQLLTIEEVATALKQSVSTIRQKVYRGELEAVRLGQHGPLRVPADALEEHLRPAREPDRDPGCDNTRSSVIVATSRASGSREAAETPAAVPGLSRAAMPAGRPPAGGLVLQPERHA